MMQRLILESPKHRQYKFRLAKLRSPRKCMWCDAEIPAGTKHWVEYGTTLDDDDLSVAYDTGRSLCERCMPPEGCQILQRWETYR